MSNGLVSFKKYSWFASIVVMVVIGVAGLTVQDFSWLPSQYQNYVVMLIGICGVFAKIFVENSRVSRAEDLVHEEYRREALSDDDIRECINEPPVLNDEYTNGGDRL